MPWSQVVEENHLAGPPSPPAPLRRAMAGERRLQVQRLHRAQKGQKTQGWTRFLGWCGFFGWDSVAILFGRGRLVCTVIPCDPM